MMIKRNADNKFERGSGAESSIHGYATNWQDYAEATMVERDGVRGVVYSGLDDDDNHESVVIIRGETEDAPATVGRTGTSVQLASSSMKRVLDELC